MKEKIIFEYVKVGEEEFNKYLDDIRETLKDKAKEWEVHCQITSNPHKVCFHLNRWDFSGGRDMKWDIPLNTWVFAYHDGDGDKEYYLLNAHPLKEWS